MLSTKKKFHDEDGIEGEFPFFIPLSPNSVAKLKSGLFGELAMNPSISFQEFDERINLMKVKVGQWRYDGEDNLDMILRSAIGYNPILIYINFMHYENIDAIEYCKFIENVSDIWFAGPDDIDIFDCTMKWNIQINHEGEIFIARRDEKRY